MPLTPNALLTRLQAFFPQDRPIVALSPHPDDVIWSVGGVLQQLANAGHSITLVSIFTHTIYVYDDARPPAEASIIRRAEDYAAARQAGFRDTVSLEYPDGVLRDRPTAHVLDPAYQTPPYLRDMLVRHLQKVVPTDATLLMPGGFGGHMDHLTTRRVAMELPNPKVIYQDLPYATRAPGGQEAEAFLATGWQPTIVRLTPAMVQSHIDLFWQYRSQASQEVADEIEHYLQDQGLTLWTPGSKDV